MLKKNRKIFDSHFSPKEKSVLVGNILLICLFLWYCSATIIQRYSYAQLAVVVFAVFISYLYLYLVKEVEKCEELEKHQLTCLNSIIMFVSLLFLVVAIVDGDIKDRLILICSIVLFLFSTVATEIRIILHCLKNNKDKTICKKKIYCVIGFAFFFGVYFYLLLSYGVYPFKWDASLYYQACQNINLFSLSSTAIYGHTAQTFGVLMKLFSTIFGSVTYAAYFLNLSIYCCSVFAFYGFLKHVFAEKSKILYIVLTCIYACNPLMLGMVCYLNLDFLCQSLFMIVIYFMIKKEWIYFSVASILFCFTKEPAIVIYAFLCMGIVVSDYLEKRNKEKNIALKLLCNGKYWFMLLCGLIWLIIYKILGPWSAGNGGTEINYSYVIEKLKVLYILNFNWLLLGMSILFLGIIIIRNKSGFKWVIPIVFAQVGFTVFSCIFKTVNHPRYSDSSIVTLCILGCSFLMMIPKKKIQLLLSSILVCLMAVSVFRTIDPVSKKVFTQIDIGETNMITTNTSGKIGDAAIYNRQMSHMEVPLCEALAYAFEQDSIVLWPMQDNCPWYFDGMIEFENIEEEYVKKEIFWDNKRKIRLLDNTKNVEKQIVYELSDSAVIADIVKQENIKQDICYIYVDAIGKKTADHIRSKYTLTDEEDFIYNGWNIHLIQFNGQEGVED